jgi:hypothetical protein
MSIMNWLGGDLAEKVTEAAKAGINDTLQQCVEDGEAGTSMEVPAHGGVHPWYGLSARVENAVTLEEAQEVSQNTVAGKFGATKKRGDYAFFLERASPYLRPIADRNFTDLPANIRKHIDG